MMMILSTTTASTTSSSGSDVIQQLQHVEKMVIFYCAVIFPVAVGRSCR